MTVESAPPEVAADEIAEAVDRSLGLKMISIRLPVAMIEDYKLIAKLRGMVYQPLMRDALAEWIDQAKTEVLKNLVLSGEAE